MPVNTSRKSYPLDSEKTSKVVVEDSKKKTSLLRDNSWIKKDANDDKSDQNSNFGRSVLKYRSTENLASASEKSSSVTVQSASPTSPTKRSSSIQSLSRRFGASQDELDSKGPITSTVKNDTKTTVKTTRTSELNSPTKTETITKTFVSDVKGSVGKIQRQSATTTEETVKNTSTQITENVTVTTSKGSVREEFKTKSVTTPTTTETIKVVEEIKTAKAVTSPIASRDITVREEFKTQKSVTSPTKSKDFTVREEIKTVQSVMSPTVSKDITVREEFKAQRSVTSPTKSRDFTVREEIKTVESVLTPTASKDITVREEFNTQKSVTSPSRAKDVTVREEIKTVQTVMSPTVSKDITVREEFKTQRSVTSAKSTDVYLQDEFKTAKAIMSPTTSKDFTVREEIKTVQAVSSPTSTVKSSTSTRSYTNQTPESKTSTSYTITTKSNAEDHLFETLIPTSIKAVYSESDTLSKDKGSETSSTTYRRSFQESSGVEDYSSDRVFTRTVRDIQPESRQSFSRSSLNSYDDQRRRSSSTTYTTYTENRSGDFSDIYASRNVETVYVSNEKDLCTYCRKPMLSDTKMILDDADIKCHASCFKCDVCNTSLGHLKAGDSMWIHRRTVHCEACFGIAKGKWHR